MSVTRNPARPCAGSPAYSPDNLPVYRGGSAGGGSTPISCAYPLDASEAAIQGLGYTARLGLSDGDQTVSLAYENSGFRTEAALQAVRTTVAISSVPEFGVVIDPISVSTRTGWGILWEIVLSTTTSDTGDIDDLITLAFGVIENSDGSYDVYKQEGSQTIITNVANAPRIGVYANSIGYGVTVDGTDYGTAIDLNVLAGEDVVEAGFRGAFMVDYGDPADVGTTNTLRFITDASEMVSGDLPPGYTDPCGNTI